MWRGSEPGPGKSPSEGARETESRVRKELTKPGHGSGSPHFRTVADDALESPYPLANSFVRASLHVVAGTNTLRSSSLHCEGSFLAHDGPGDNLFVPEAVTHDAEQIGNGVGGGNADPHLNRLAGRNGLSCGDPLPTGLGHVNLGVP